MKQTRLYFIDIVRAIAILMMLQGHFVDTLLDPQFRNEDYTAFRIWSYFRGITAPTFFTISGLIFTYLMLKAKQKGELNYRIKKGIIRGFMLIGIGYLLRIPLFQIFYGDLGTAWLAVDVLQCIGLSLIMVVLLYVFTFKKTLIFSILLFILGTVIFITEPWYRNLEINNLPIAIANYMTKTNKSVFTILPWFGYVAYGGFLATIFYKYLERNTFKKTVITSLFIIGFFLINHSTSFLYFLHRITDLEIIKLSAGFNYLFKRLGDVFMLFALFYLLEAYLKHSLILKIGQKTLSIYVIHFIIIYGSFTGLGLNRLIGKTLQPWEAVIGALSFWLVVCVIALNYVKTNQFIYGKINRLFGKMKESKED